MRRRSRVRIQRLQRGTRPKSACTTSLLQRQGVEQALASPKPRNASPSRLILPRISYALSRRVFGSFRISGTVSSSLERGSQGLGKEYSVRRSRAYSVFGKRRARYEVRAVREKKSVGWRSDTLPAPRSLLHAPLLHRNEYRRDGRWWPFHSPSPSGTLYTKEE